MTKITAARRRITGTFCRSDLSRITSRIAWSVTTPEADRDATEADLSALRDECVAALDESGGAAVRVVRGRIASVLCG